MLSLTRLCFSCSLLLVSIGLYAQENISLSQAVEIGLRNNYQIQIAERDVEIAQNNNDWAIAGKYPTIDLTFSANNTYSSQNNPVGFLRALSSFNTSVTPGIEANWILFDGYRVRITKQQLEQQEVLSHGNLQVAVENTIQSVILAYYNALVQKEQLDVLTEVLELSRDRVEYQEVRREFGQAGTFDVLQTQDAYLNDSTSYLVQATTYANALRNLNLAMGEDNLDQQYTLSDELTFTTEDYDLEAMRTKLLANNKSLQNLFINRELARIGTQLEETEKYPQVSLRGGATYNSSWTLAGKGTFSGENDAGEPISIERDIGGVKNTSTNGFINLSASYNLFDAGIRKKRIENAQKEELIAQLNIEDLKRNLNGQLETTLATFNNQKELVKLTNQLVENAQQNLEIAEERFRGGLINSFDYRTIQVGYINASQQRLNAIFNLKNTETELVKLIGGLIR